MVFLSLIFALSLPKSAEPYMISDPKAFHHAVVPSSEVIIFFHAQLN